MANGIMYVDNIRVEFDDSHKSVLEVCAKAGVEVPNFCFHSDLSVYGACRMCMVEDDKGNIEAACQMAPKDGLKIRTKTSRLLRYRRTIMELILAAHCRDCTTCEKNRACRLQDMAMRFGIHDLRFKDTRNLPPVDHTSRAITVDMS